MTDTIITDKNTLRQVSKPVTEADIFCLDLVNRLRAACSSGWVDGCGLAAIQIGIPLRFAWYKWGDTEYTLVNPEIISTHGKHKAKKEGCLSIPGKWLKAKRYSKIKYTTDGKKKTAKGLRAQIIQHEIDHMNGILIDD